MTKKRIGALTIGQSPRPDLVAPLEELLPDCEILQAGALDDLTMEEVRDASNDAYRLVTQMRNRAVVMVGESFIAPRLQVALNRLEAQGVVAALLLCAGTFENLHGTRPLYKPFKIGCGVLRALNMKSIGLITPVAEQEVPIQQRWEAMGWEPTVWTADLGVQDEAFQQQLDAQIHLNELDCIVLDFVGHPLEQVTQLQRAVQLPVFDLGYLAMVTLAGTM
jgi:protein AroM